MNSHYGVIMFGGDPAEEHDDPDLRGHGPSMEFICAGPEQFCWDSLAAWTAKHPLRLWEEAEVLTRDPSVVRTEETPDEFRRRVEANTVDPEDHDYQGDGTSRCPVCLGQMNDHISWGKTT